MKLKLTFLTICALVLSTSLTAQKYLNSDDVAVTKEYMGATMSSEKTLLENLQNAPALSTTAIIYSDLENIFGDHEMVTVFAPLNSSFNTMSEEELKTFLTNKAFLKRMVNYHMVPGRLDLHGIKKAIGQGGGTAYFATLSGEKLGARLVGDNVVLFDTENNTATLKASDFYHKSGFLHLVDGLVSPSEQQ
ncbi:fasciclin domain-containing protein [Constantimarinum furrinae]|uniref:FAS1 domain-containing protein n=1 Tax=Constantimarinum furrinae TaxID=2562285 RepID=A0A7G8PXW9_9FLAO|nr:fasciclin domain-containing protein [Constantimarinum furrinae]QNJ99185.1 hypothetical protein ALE3EI_2658 [Constantimarinum furrinae]